MKSLQPYKANVLLRRYQLSGKSEDRKIFLGSIFCVKMKIDTIVYLPFILQLKRRQFLCGRQTGAYLYINLNVDNKDFDDGDGDQKLELHFKNLP